MKQLSVLLVTYNWPPRNAIGSHRPYSWAKYWSEAGARVVVLTAAKHSFDEPLDLELPELPGVNVIEVDYLASSRQRSKTKTGAVSKLPFVSFLKQAKVLLATYFGLTLDIRDAWCRAALPHAQAVVRETVPDVIVSSYGPRATHLIAAHVKRDNPRVRWVADYRDLWSLNHLAAMSKSGRRREVKSELATVGLFADAITTVSQGLSDQLNNLLGKRPLVVTNGFDVSLEDLKRNIERGAERSSAGQTIRIVYTGMIYSGRRDPRPLFRAVNELLSEGSICLGAVKIDFYGTRQADLQKMIDQEAAQSFVEVHGHVSRGHALEAQSSSGLLLLLESGASDAKGVLTGKLFEYMASGRPVLALGSSDDSAIGQMLRDCSVGVAVGNDVERIKAVLISMTKADALDWFHPDIGRIAAFSRKSQADLMLGLISSLVRNGER